MSNPNPQEQTQQAAPTTTEAPRAGKSEFELMLERDFIPADRAAEFVDVMIEDKEYRLMWAKASGYSRSRVLPPYFQGPDNVSTCYIALELARRLRLSELMIFQSTYVVHGKLGFSGQFAIAVVNSSGRFATPIQFEIVGGEDPFAEGYKVRAWVKTKGGERLNGPWIDWKMVKAEKWDLPKGDTKQPSKWATIPGLMFMYRAGTYFARTNCPELLMGFQTVEEIEDVGEQPDTQPAKRMSLHRQAETKPSPHPGAAAPSNAPGSDNQRGSESVKAPAGSTFPGEPLPAKGAEKGAGSPVAMEAPTSQASAPSNTAGAGEENASSPAPKGGRPKAKKAKYCTECGALAVHDGTCTNCGLVNVAPTNGTEAGGKEPGKTDAPASAPGGDPRTAEQIADEYAQVEAKELVSTMSKIKSGGLGPKHQEWARRYAETHSITFITEAPIDAVRAMARAWKIFDLELKAKVAQP